MNKFSNKIVFALLALMLLGGSTYAQFTTTFAKNAMPGQQDGLYYSLPQTMLQLDFTIRETVCDKGPLSDYADKYFENEDYVDYNTTTYELVDVKMTSLATPDPNATFFVTFASVRGAGKPVFDVLPNGIIRRVGVRGDKEVLASENVQIQEFAKPIVENAPIESASFLPLMTSGKSNGQLAKEVVDKIEEIRKAKFYLISGDVEMAGNPETFNAMYQKMDDLEREYLSLFLGKRSVRTVVKTVYVIPTKETENQTVAIFSETDGLTVGTSGSGSDIVVQVLPFETTAFFNAPSQSAIESMTYENKIIYRIPDLANVKVIYRNQTLMESRQTINQLGVLLMAPLTNSRLEFDTSTGQIVNMKVK